MADHTSEKVEPRKLESDGEEAEDDESVMSLMKDPGSEEIKTADSNFGDRLSNCRQFWMLIRFIAPLAVTQMVPDLAEQVINRGITSIASDEMVQLLASFGLAVYVIRLFAATAMELRHVSIVMVHCKKDNSKMTVMSIVIGVVLSICILLLSLTPAGTWLIRDIHGHNQEVSDLTNRIMACLSPVPLIEALANYYEGGLIHFKLTVYAGVARFTDFGMQLLFVIVLLLTCKTMEPMLVPVYSVYAGYLARLVLDIGFWYVLVRRKLPKTHDSEKPLTVSKAMRFWIPLACVRIVQVVSRPLLNLVVSRNLSIKVGKEAAAKAMAVLTAIYPTGRMLFSWLNDLRTIPPTFHKDTPQHKKFKMKTLAIFAFGCTAIVFTLNAALFIIPGPGYAIMHDVVGLTDELSQLSLLPLKIFSGICLCVGLRAHLTGFLILKKKTFYLTPSAVGRLIGLIIFLATLTHTQLSGAVLGITVLFLSFVVEVILVVAASLLARFKPDLRLTPACLRKKNTELKDVDEALPLSTQSEDVNTRV